LTSKKLTESLLVSSTRIPIQETLKQKPSSKKSAKRFRFCQTKNKEKSTTLFVPWAAAPDLQLAVSQGQGGGFEDVFSNLFGGGGRGFPGGFGGGFDFGPAAGVDLTARTSIDFIDSIKGATIKLALQGMEALNVKIPAGVQDGQKIKLRGKGRPSPNGGPSGDLIITVRVKPHPVFTRDGENLRVTVPVTFTEAALGANILVPTLGGEPVKLKINPGCPNGRVLRIQGRGVDAGNARGDLLATVEVAVPSHMSEKAKKALQDFQAVMPDEDPRTDLLSRAGLL
jgi:molecular chaperone DnaJ